MSDPQDGQTRVIDRICDQFEGEWQAGKAPRVEDYLTRVAPTQRERLLQELLALEIEYRLRRGERPALAEYQQRFAAQATVVTAVFARPAPTVPSPPSWPPTQAPAQLAVPSGEPQATLTVIEGPRQGEVFTFSAHEMFIVGRSAKAHLCIADDYLSRYHFLLEVVPPLCRLMDLGSRNRTQINGQVLEKNQSRMVQGGDVIRAGRTTMRLTISQPDDSSTCGGGQMTLDLPAAAPSADVTAAWSPTPSRGPGPSASPSTSPPSGDEVRRPAQDVCPLITGYQIERELGQGGMGVVYLAVRERDGRRVALKTIIPAGHISSTQVQRFIREANILRRLRHKHIVEFLDADECNGVLYLTMSYVEGTDAAHLLHKQGPLPVPTAVRMTYQLLSALAYAHAEGFVHRDIKPANLLVTQEDGKRSVKLADFGLARVYQESRMSGLTVEGDVGGTVAFMAPEQIASFRKTPPSADQYSAAATLYNLLTGHLPFEFGQGKGNALSIILQNDPVPILERRGDVPRGLAEIVHRGLAKDPAARYSDVSALKAALAPFV
jgi:serine/threonine-protein kinase